MAPKWTDNMNLKFVELYKEQRCLWDQLNALYKDKMARETALVAIAENLHIQGFGAAEVKAKIKAFRGTFNIEFAKLNKSAKSGSGSSELYVPSLKWFNEFKDVMVKGTLTRNTKNTLMPGSCKLSPAGKDTDDISTFVEPRPTSADNAEPSEEQVAPEPSANISYSGISQETCGDYPPPKKFKPRSKIQQIASAARDLKGLSEAISRNTDKENEWDIFGRHVVAQIKLLSPVQALTAQMEINNVLTKCRFNDLYGGTSSKDSLLTVSTDMCTAPSTSSTNSTVRVRDISRECRKRLKRHISS